MTIEENNKLIAEFMGGKFKTSEDGFNYCELPNEVINLIKDPMLGSNWVCMNFMFHSSWDWLKPVIDKIIKDNSFKIIDECSKNEWYYITSISQMYIGVDVLQAHHYVCEYIHWLNREQNKNLNV